MENQFSAGDVNEAFDHANSLRGQYLAYVNQVERVLEEHVSKHFFGQINENFIQDVLDDGVISFYSLRQIFLNCLESRGLKEEKDFFDRKLQEFGKLRNRIIHGHILSRWDDGFYKGLIIRRGKREGAFSEPTIQFEELFTEIIKKLSLLNL